MSMSEQAAPFWPLDEARSNARHAVVSNDLVDREAAGTRLSFLTLNRLLRS
jgi:hypothetical protein